MRNNITISEIREKYQYHGLYSQYINDHMLALISPYFTKIFVSKGIVPNKVTGLMMLFGVIGAILFAIPNLYIKWIGIVAFYLWYAMDLCDGEVARITKNFSTYGKELDYTAHAIDHPLFTLSFMLNVYEDMILVFLIAALGLLDSIFRNFQTFEVVWRLKEISEGESSSVASKGVMRFLKYIFLNLSTFPLFVLIFPIVVMFSYKYAYIYVVAAIITTITIDFLSIKSWLSRTL